MSQLLFRWNDCPHRELPHIMVLADSYDEAVQWVKSHKSIYAKGAVFVNNCEDLQGWMNPALAVIVGEHKPEGAIAEVLEHSFHWPVLNVR